MRLTRTINVALPPDEVFALWADLERSPEYSAASIERRNLGGAAVGVGSRFHAVDRWPGRKVEFTVEVTAFDPPRRMAASWSEPMPGWWEARFSPAGEGTEVAFTTVMEPSGAMAVFTNLMRPWAARQLGRFMRDFRAWAERQPTSSIGRLGSTPAEARTTTAR